MGGTDRYARIPANERYSLHFLLYHYHIGNLLLVSHPNKVYSRETCVFLPKLINVALVTRYNNRGKYLIGVSWDKTNKAFKAQVCKNKGKQEKLGYYNTEIGAHLAYKEAKESYLKELADKYKDLLDPRAYEALYNYTVDIDD